MKLRDLYKWQRGRQETGYDKMFLGGAMWPITFDMYLLRFPEGSEIPEHTDQVETGRHYRLNIVIKKARLGGEFFCKCPVFDTSRIKLFRPDIYAHSVTKIKKGTRYVVSLGWIVNG